MTILSEVLELSESMTAGFYRLSAEELAVLFFMWNYMDRTSTWRSFRGENITSEDQDAIDALTGNTIRALMMPMIGWVVPFMTAEPPEGVLPADGSTYLREDWPALYAALDPIYQIGADSFFLPDLSNLTIIGASIDRAFGSIGGQSAVELGIPNLPSHSHSDTGHVHTYQPPGATGLAVSPGELPVLLPALVPSLTGSASANITSTGGNVAHENMQPYIALRYGVIAG